MPSKSTFVILPFLDPEFDLTHPENTLVMPKEDPYAPLKKRQREALRKYLLEEAMKNYKPSHVLRSWESDEFRKRKHDQILKLVLSYEGSPSTVSTDLVLQSKMHFADRSGPHDSSATRKSATPYDSTADILHNDFREFTVSALHLGYHRFHPSTDPGPEAETDPPETSEPDVCWIMEYTENECTTIRRQLAHLIGLYPAAIDEEIEAYDEEVAWRYERRLKSRCTRRNKRCIRPSHIEIFTQCGRLLP